MKQAGPGFYLASASPRRRRLLEGVGLRFAVIEVDIEEVSVEGEAPADYVRRMAREKAFSAAARIGREGLEPLPVLASDTCVSIDDSGV